MNDFRVAGMEAERGRWLYVLVGFLMNLCLGAVYAYSVFRQPLQNLWGINATQVGLPFMVFLAMFAVAMALAGPLIERWGPRKTSLLGGVFVGAGWILSGFSPNIWVLTALYGGIAGGGVGILYGCPIAVSAKWFPDRKGLAVGLTVMGFGISALLMAPVIGAFIPDPVNAPGQALLAFKVLGVVFFALLFLLALPLRFPPQGWLPRGCEPGKGKVPLRVGADLDRRQMLRTGLFYALWGCFTIGCLAGLLAIGIAKPFGTEVARLQGTLATVSVSVFAIFNGLGRPLFGWLTDRLTPRYAAALSFFLILAAAALLYFLGEGSAPIYLVGFSVLWMNLGGWLAIAPTATATFFGTKHYAKNYGIVFSSYGLGAILGTLLSGQIKDLTGSYLTVFVPVMALAAFGAVLAFAGLRPRKA